MYRNFSYLVLSVICSCIIRSLAGGMYAPPVLVVISPTGFLEGAGFSVAGASVLAGLGFLDPELHVAGQI